MQMCILPGNSKISKYSYYGPRSRCEVLHDCYYSGWTSYTQEKSFQEEREACCSITGKASNTGVVQPCKNFFIQDKHFCYNCTPVEAQSHQSFVVVILSCRLFFNEFQNSPMQQSEENPSSRSDTGDTGDPPNQNVVVNTHIKLNIYLSKIKDVRKNNCL